MHDYYFLYKKKKKIVIFNKMFKILFLTTQRK